VIYGSVCSGIEAATAAWHPLGWKASFFSEIEAFPRSVLAHHYPETPLHGDFTTIKAGEYEPIDLLVGGTPCQSFSIAGLRGGLDDDRGNLALEYLRLADRLRPRWLVWENVPGVLSSNGGRDFGSILGGMGELGYGVAYRVLDAQFFGVAQRRRRVFVVGYLGDWRRAGAVLFERDSLSGNPAPRRKAREGASGSLGIGASGGGGGPGAGTDEAAAGYLQAVPSTDHTAHCLIAARMVSFGEYVADGTASVMKSRDYKDATDLVAFHSNAGSHGGDVFADLCPTLRAQKTAGGAQTAVTSTLTATYGRQSGQDMMADNLLVAFDTTQITSPQNRSNPKPGDPCHTLAKGSHAPAIAFGGDIARTLSRRHDGSPCADRGPDVVAVAFTCSDQSNAPGWERPYAPTLNAQVPNDTSNIQTGVRIGSAVRRLTPRECERLQGFPDDFTVVLHRGKPAADGPRYKALGNSMAVPCMAWIGRRIDAVDALPINQAVAS
jgi:DNA (cytosine-5)-methyltransferase 1